MEKTAEPATAERIRRESIYPHTPLSVGRDIPLETMARNISGLELRAMAFRERKSPFLNTRLETVVNVRLPYFLFTIREGHLFSSCAPFPFPFDSVHRYLRPGELTILSTGSILATLRFLSSNGKRTARLLERETELSLRLWEALSLTGALPKADSFQAAFSAT